MEVVGRAMRRCALRIGLGIELVDCNCAVILKKKDRLNEICGRWGDRDSYIVVDVRRRV